MPYLFTQLDAFVCRRVCEKKVAPLMIVGANVFILYLRRTHKHELFLYFNECIF